jgi:hypothetical protein
MSKPQATIRDPDRPRILSGTSQDARPDDLGHEGVESNIKGNTTKKGPRHDRGP